MKDRLWLLVCPHFLGEASAVIRDAGYVGVQVAAFPAVCIRPTANADDIYRQATSLTARGATVAMLGGHCLIGLAPDSSAGSTVRLLATSRCLEFVAPADLLDAQIADGAYLLTPGWLRRWRQHMVAWGFDQTTARLFFAETTHRLVLLDTGVSADASMHLRGLADFLALPYQVIPVGLQRFAAHLARTLAESNERGKLSDRTHP